MALDILGSLTATPAADHANQVLYVRLLCRTIDGADRVFAIPASTEGDVNHFTQDRIWRIAEQMWKARPAEARGDLLDRVITDLGDPLSGMRFNGDVITIGPLVTVGAR